MKHDRLVAKLAKEFNLDNRVVDHAVRYSFRYITKQMESGNWRSIWFKYFGTFTPKNSLRQDLGQIVTKYNNDCNSYITKFVRLIIIMAKLFDLENGKIKIDPKSLSIPTFHKIWKRDKKLEHPTATKEITYIAFLCDHNSPYKDVNPLEKEQRIREDIFGDTKWKPDKLIEEAIQYYNDLQETTNSRLLKSAKIAAEQLAAYFEGVNFNQRDDYGKLIYNAKDVTANLKSIGELVKSLTMLEKQVQAEQSEQSGIRGGGELGSYELPDKEFN
jgi:uncharacterized protein (UPF0335 family)